MRPFLRSIEAEDVVQVAPGAVAVAIAGFVFLFGASTWAPGGSIHENVETLGITLIAVHAVGRAWCWGYAHPINQSALITTGPYSLCRNPQDLFLIIGGIGIGALLGSITSAFAGGLALWGIACLRIIEEERRLRASYRDRFQTYRSRLPKFIPDPSLWQRPDAALFRKKSLFIGILKAWPLASAIFAEKLVEKLHILH